MLQEFLDVPNVQLCPSCGTRLAAPEWSEPLSAGRTASVWCCQICSNSFLTPMALVRKRGPGTRTPIVQLKLSAAPSFSHCVDVS